MVSHIRATSLNDIQICQLNLEARNMSLIGLIKFMKELYYHSYYYQLLQPPIITSIGSRINPVTADDLS